MSDKYLLFDMWNKIHHYILGVVDTFSSRIEYDEDIDTKFKETMKLQLNHIRRHGELLSMLTTRQLQDICMMI